MADNLTTGTPLATVPSASTIATRDVSSVHFQRMHQAPDDFISTNNSTVATLGIGATFTGPGDDCFRFAAVTVTLFSDENSAANGMLFQFSTDNTNWDDVNTYTYTNTNGRRFQFPVTARYFRIVYTNGGTGQGVFRVQTILHTTDVKDSIHRLVDDMSPDRSVQARKVAVFAQINGTGDFMPIQSTAAGILKVGFDLDDIVSTNNSTTTPLGIAGTFVGTGDDLLGYSSVTVMLDASHDSATDGMVFEFSTDNVNWDDTDQTYTYTAADGSRRFVLPAVAQYFRVNYTNGGTGQTHLRLQTMLHRMWPGGIQHRIGDSTGADRSATIGKAAIIAQRAGSGDFVPVQSTTVGNLKISVQELSDGIDVGAGAVASETQRITLASDDPAVASLAIIDDWDESDRAKVNPIVGQAGVAAGAGAVGVTVPRTTLASDDPAVASLGVIDDWDNAASDGASVSGDVAHDSVDAGEPVKVGLHAVAHGASPTAVAAADRTNWYANRHGIPWMIGGHPNSVTFRVNYTGAQTNTAIVTVSGGSKIVVTRCTTDVDNACSVDVQARIGFAAATTPTGTGVVQSHPGFAAGSGLAEGNGGGELGIGADGEDLRITSEVPTGGSIDVVVTYYIVPS